MGKKLNIVNPAEMFIDTPQNEPRKIEIVYATDKATPIKKQTTEQPKTAPKRRKENKSKHIQVLMKPSLFERIQAAADEEGVSVNAYINRATEKYYKDNLF